MKPTKEQQEDLNRLSKTIAKTYPGYLRNPTNDNFKFIKKKFLSMEHTEIMSSQFIDMTQLIVDSGIYASITSAYRDSVGSVPEIGDSEMKQFIDSIVSTGKGGWKVVNEDGEDIHMEAVQSSRYFESSDNVYTEIILYNLSGDNYAFTRTFYVGYNENHLYKMGMSTNICESIECPLSIISDTLQPIEVTNMSVPAFFEVDTGDKIFEYIESLVDSTDRRMTQIELEFHRYLDAKVIYKGINIMQDAQDPNNPGRILKEKLGNNFFSADTTASIEYVVNSNPMVDKAMEFINQDIRRISAISKVPLDYLGVETTGAVGNDSRISKNAIFFAKVEKYRSIVSKAYETLIGGTLNFGPIVGYENSTDTGTGTVDKTVTNGQE